MLNLPSIFVEEIDGDNIDYWIKASIKNQQESRCVHCYKPSPRKHGVKSQQIMDTPMHGKRVGIQLYRQRFKCDGCNRTFIESCSDISDKHRTTERLVDYIKSRCLVRTNTTLAEEVGISEGTVRNIFRDHITELDRSYQFETPRVLGVDEVHLNKKMRLVLTNIEQRTLLDMAHSRTKATVIEALGKLDAAEKVQVVTMDMWRPYREAVAQMLPKAVVVIDKFHVVRMANDAVEKARKEVRLELSPKQRIGLKNDRFLLLKRRCQLTDQQKFLLEGWTLNYPLLAAAYDAKEKFYEIYEANSRHESEQLYTEWKQSVPAGLRGKYGDLVRVVDNWHDQVFSYFDHPYTNAYTESINAQIKAMYRQGSGYSFEALRARMLFTEAKHKVRSVPYRSRLPGGCLKGSPSLNYGAIIHIH